MNRFPSDLEFFAAFSETTRDGKMTLYIVEFQRTHYQQSDQYYAVALPFNAPVISSDPRAVFEAALVWDCADSLSALSKKIAVWLGEKQP